MITESMEENNRVIEAIVTEDTSVPHHYVPPWSIPVTKDKSSTSYARFRQHVNPLARKYQMQTILPPNWPQCDFDDVSLPLFVDVGCGKGGFLLDLAGRHRGIRRNSGDGLGGKLNSNDNDNDATTTTTSLPNLPSHMNYLGIEIRPGVSQYAQSRVSKHGLDGLVSYIGCNANVDLDRVLTLYTNASSSFSSVHRHSSSGVSFVTIQFPDPHFKKSHAKRRVVTTELVTTLAKFVLNGGGVFLQSDVREALEAMREKFVEEDGVGERYFEECFPNDDGLVDREDRYGMENPLGLPTEREGSVLVRGLPVYRTLFQRNGVAFEEA